MLSAQRIEKGIDICIRNLPLKTALKKARKESTPTLPSRIRWRTKQVVLAETIAEPLLDAAKEQHALQYI